MVWNSIIKSETMNTLSADIAGVQMVPASDVLATHGNRFLRRIRLNGVGKFDPIEGNLATRDRLLVESVKLFAQYGYDACSMKDLAKAVNIGAPAIYNHFASKSELLGASIDLVLSTFYEAVLAEIKAETSLECLMEMVARHADFTVRNRPLARASDSILNTEFMRRTLPQDDSCRFVNAIEEYRAILAELIDDAVGHDPKVESAMRAFVVHQIADRAGEWYEPQNAPLDPDSITRQCQELAMRVIRL